MHRLFEVDNHHFVTYIFRPVCQTTWLRLQLVSSFLLLFRSKICVPNAISGRQLEPPRIQADLEGFGLPGMPFPFDFVLLYGVCFQ